jgi:hypothetical protein
MQLVSFVCAVVLGASGCVADPGVSAVPAGSNEADNELRLVNSEWRVVSMATAHGSLVIDVEAVNPADARKIAYSLTEPLVDQYDEVLVHVAQIGDSSGESIRRIQWTRAAGYVEQNQTATPAVR